MTGSRAVLLLGLGLLSIACRAQPANSTTTTTTTTGGAPTVASVQATPEPSAHTAAGQEPPRAIIERYCNSHDGPGRESLMVMRDASGTIGGYVYSMGIMDSPISYLSPTGEQVAMFHIFGSDEEKQRNAPTIEALRQAYPVQTALECTKR